MGRSSQTREEGDACRKPMLQGRTKEWWADEGTANVACATRCSRIDVLTCQPLQLPLLLDSATALHDSQPPPQLLPHHRSLSCPHPQPTPPQQRDVCSHYQTKPELWGHFLRGGAYEGRSFRFTCPASNIQAPL